MIGAISTDLLYEISKENDFWFHKTLTGCCFSLDSVPRTARNLLTDLGSCTDIVVKKKKELNRSLSVIFMECLSLSYYNEPLSFVVHCKHHSSDLNYESALTEFQECNTSLCKQILKLCRGIFSTVCNFNKIFSNAKECHSGSRKTTLVILPIIKEARVFSHETFVR